LGTTFLSSHQAPNSTRIAIVDDHPIVCFGVRMALEQIPGLEIIGEADEVDQAIELVKSSQPDLLTLDLLLNGRMETGLIAHLKALCPSMHILVFTSSAETTFAPGVLRAGASGYLMKSDGLMELQKATQQILAGKVYISERMNDILIAAAATGQIDGSLSRLTSREMEIFHLLGRGMTTAEIARELNLSIKTVAAHRDNLKAKLNAATSVELIQKAVSSAFGQEV
jgi:DNA-binding NarL/FixJ family response regulator